MVEGQNDGRDLRLDAEYKFLYQQDIFQIYKSVFEIIFWLKIDRGTTITCLKSRL